MANPDPKTQPSYRPGNPPAPGSTQEQVVRAIWEELARIAAAIPAPLVATPQTPEQLIAQRGNG